MGFARHGAPDQDRIEITRGCNGCCSTRNGDAGMTRKEKALAILEARGNISALELCELIHCVHRQARRILVSLRDDKKAYVSDWRKSTGEGVKGRTPTSLWSAGDKSDMPRPERDSFSEIQSRRKTRLIEKHGKEIALKILRPRTRGGVSVMQRDHSVIYARRSARGVAGGRKRQVANG